MLFFDVKEERINGLYLTPMHQDTYRFALAVFIHFVFGFKFHVNPGNDTTLIS